MMRVLRISQEAAPGSSPGSSAGHTGNAGLPPTASPAQHWAARTGKAAWNCSKSTLGGVVWWARELDFGDLGGLFQP